MSFGFGFGFPKNYVAALFSPAQLFTGSTNGVWYDPSDFSTMFQDAAGTTPVTAVGQPVGLMLDKSKGLVLGPELVTNGDFSSPSGWVLSTLGGSATISGGLLTLSGGSSAYPNATQSAILTSGKWYKVIVVLTSTISSGSLSLRLGGSTSQYTAFTNSGVYTLNILSNGANLMLIRNSGFTDTITIDNISVRELPGNHAYNPSGNSANFPVFSARYNLLTATGTLSTQTVTTQATNYTLTFSGVGAVTLSGTATGVYTAGTYTFNATVGSLIVTVAGMVSNADLRPTNDALNQPAYQRVNTATDYDTVGFKPYLSFNGVNQWLQTNSIDFTYGDKMFVSAGFRALNPSLYQVATELSASFSSNAGGFAVFKNGSNAQAWYFGSSGTIFQYAEKTGYAEPVTSVISGISNISGDQAILRVNGTQAAISTVDQGTGKYGNYPLYIGARSGTSLFFNGRLYGLVVAGKQASAGEIASTESWLNQKTGAY